MGNIFEKIAMFFKGLIGLCLLAAGGALAVVVAYFSIMSCVRLIDLLAKSVFDSPWR